MSEPLDEPNWESLPHDPVRFFELGESFDRKDLKRAYNRLLRRFKPEKFPAEFQRIRAAYEELDEQIRYHGGATRQPIRAPEDWRTEEVWAAPAPSAARPPQKLPSEVLVARLASESPRELFRELCEKNQKTPFDFYALAILSDVVEKSAIGFATWLLKGIDAHPHDGAIRQLLHEYFRGPVTAKALLEILPLTANVIGTDEFYPLTEPAWQVLLKEESFSVFEVTLGVCESQLRDSHIVGRMAFLIQMLKSTMWCDGGSSGTGWSARQFDFVEENFESIPPWLEWDVDLLGVLREYVAVREQFVAGSPLRQQLDAALKDYFSESQEVGDRSIVACQMAILSASDALLEEFPIDQGELFSQFYPIWAWATHDVAERQSIEQDTEFNDNIWTSRAEVLLLRAEKACNNSMTGIMWTGIQYGRMIAWVVVFLALGVFGCGVLLFAVYLFVEWTGRGARGSWDMLSIVGGVVLSVLGTWKLMAVVERHWWNPLHLKFAAKCYNQLWRRELLDFQKRSRVPHTFFRAVFEHFSGKNATTSWIHHFVQQDYAPALLAGAQRFEA